MNGRHFLVLYRQFLFRIVDLEALSPHARGDANRLLGQFAALLISVSVVLSAPALFSGNGPRAIPEAAVFVGNLVGQHFLISTTMLVVGLFAVLSWDGTFPDSRDVFVLLPLPVQARTILMAKVAAVGTALGLTVLLLHSILGLVWPLLYASDAHAVTLPALEFDPTPTPLDVKSLKPSLDRALAGALNKGALKEGTGAGLAIGVFKHGEREVWTYGAAKADALFEIGSITKTFTGLILSRMASEGKVRLYEPVRELLPAGVAPPVAGNEITLSDLATHHSGLPAMPDNFFPANPDDPYADYTVPNLYQYVRRYGLKKPEDTLYRYSNLGVGLLAQALSERAKMPYSRLVRELVTGPLDLQDTVIELSADQRDRMLQGYDDHHRPVHAWNFDALAGAGGLRSTAGDMLKYLEANLHPEAYPALTAALDGVQRIRKDAGAGAQIGLAWTYQSETGAYRHAGTTAGFTSHVFFIPRMDCAAVVLINSGPNLAFNPDLIAEHIRQRFAGEPAVELGTVVVSASPGLFGVLRSYAAYWFTMVAAALFTYGFVLAAQGLILHLLPRGLFLRVSGLIQMLAFSLTLVFFFAQPALGALDDLTARQTWYLLQWTPSFWFLGLYQQLNGTFHPALAPLAHRAWIGLLVTMIATAATYSFSYSRTLSRIVDEPELPLAPVKWRRLPAFGGRFKTAVARFAIRSLLRSKQHRLIVAFYMGIGVALTSLLLKDPSTKRALADGAAGNPWRDASVALWASSMILLALAAVGVRVAFALPVDLRANWLFQVAGTRSNSDTHASARIPFLLLAGVPVWVVSACVCIGLWPSWQSVGHVIGLGLMGLIVGELCLAGFRKIPFACSYLPGKLRIHILFMGVFGLLLGSIRVALFERDVVFKEFKTASSRLALLVLLWLVVRMACAKLALGEGETQFEEAESPAIQALGPLSE